MKSLKEKQTAVVNCFLQKQNARLEETPHYKIVTYEVIVKEKAYPSLACFAGNTSKPSNNFYYHSEERRNEVIECFKTNILSRHQQKEEKRRERKEFKTACKVGDIFVSSWGYEQTNVDYYKILEINGNTAIFVEIGQNTVEGSHGHDCCNVMPDPESIIGEPFKKIIQLGECISMASYEYCHKWEGKANYKSWYY